MSCWQVLRLFVRVFLLSHIRIQIPLLRRLEMQKLSVFVLALSMLGFASQSVFASIDIQPGPFTPSTDVSFSGSNPSNGGPFVGSIWSQESGGSVINTWTTFCVEAPAGAASGETINPNGTRYDAGVSSLYIANATGNRVSDAAKWLYYNYAYNPAAIDSANPINGNSLQQAIWSLVRNTAGQFLNAQTGADTPLDTVAAAYRAVALLNAGNGEGSTAGIFGQIRIMNPNDDGNDPDQRQSMLYQVPEASTIAVWSVLSLVGAGVAYRKRSQKLA
jgi:hypothetical protein